MKASKVLFILLSILGLLMFLVPFVLSDAVDAKLSGVLIGVGASIFVVSVLRFIAASKESRDPELQKKQRIEQTDERNIAIRSRAKARAGDIAQWFILMLSYALLLTDAPLWATLLPVAVFVLYNIIYFVLLFIYQNEM